SPNRRWDTHRHFQKCSAKIPRTGLRSPAEYGRIADELASSSFQDGCGKGCGMDYDDVINGDCIHALAKLPAQWSDLVFADPPFNIGYQYDVYHDRRRKEDYLEWADRWLAAAVRVLKPTGAMFLAIGDEFAAEHKVRLDALGMTLRNWIVWHYTFGVN